MPGSAVSDDPLQTLFALVLRHTGCDFSLYKPATVQRRLEQRWRRVGCDDLDEYLSYLSRVPGEIPKLQGHLLVGVTSFFRNPQAYESLAREWESRWASRASGPVRIWVGACSTGEEAYSLAIQFQEFLDLRAPGQALQVFATDLDQASIDKARKGWYPRTALAGLDQDRLVRWFDREGQGWRVKKVLRDKLTFAVHNLLTDPPFGQLDLLSCRNLFIYLGPQTQARLTASFAFALKPSGLLFLGTSESADPRKVWFESLDKKNKLLARRPEIRSPIPIQGSPAREKKEPMATNPSPPPPRDLTVKELVLDLIARDYTMPSVLVDGDGTIQYVWGDTAPVFRRRAGRPTDQVVENVVETLQVALANALAGAGVDRQTITVEGLRLPEPDGRPLRLTVRPVEAPALGTPHFLVVFQVFEKPAVRPEAPVSGRVSDRRIEDLERELNDTRLYLRNLVLKLESANEELAAGNEETQSMNEELQSSNEELESSREELQATNDELETLNGAHTRRIEELARLNDDMANLIASARLGMVFLDRQLLLQRFTPEAAMVLPLKEADQGSPFPALAGSLLGPGLETLLLGVLRGLQPEEREVTSGSRVLLLRVLPYRTREDRIEGLVLTLNDLTELRFAEAARRHSERKFQVLFENNPDAVLLGDLVRNPAGAVLDFRIVASNPALDRMMGGRMEGAEGKLGSELLPFLDRPWIEAMDLTTLSGKAQDFSLYSQSLGLHLKVWIYSAGENRFALILEDISQTARVQEDLRRSETLFRSTLQSMDDFVTTLDADGRYLQFFQGHRRADLFLLPEQFLGKTIDELPIPPEAKAAQKQAFEELRAGAPVAAWVYSLPYPGGTRWFSARLSPRFGAQGEWEGAVQVSREITDRINAERSLQEREAELRAVFDACPLGLFLVRGGVVIRANTAGRQMFGVHDLEGQELDRFLVRGPEILGRRTDGTTFPLRFDLVEVEPGVEVGVAQDLTERQRMERTVLNSQRLESLGVLAGGIAHDFNNLLGGLFGFLQLARKFTPDGAPAARHLDRAFSAFSRAQDLTRQLLTFSKGGEPVKRAHDLGPLLEESARFILSGGNLKLDLDLAPDLWACEVDRHQVGQVIDNLGLNARQAMPSGGRVRLSAANVPEGDPLPPGLEAGPYVRVLFADEGPGIAPEVLSRIFDPFFSTKSDGSGLGLATVHSILRKHGGTVEVDSAPGQGAAFTLWFPALPLGEAAGTGEGRILLLDDEELILDTARELMEDLGYEVTAVRDGATALEAFRREKRSGRRFGLFLTDLTLPGEKGGLAVVEQLRRLDPSLKAAASSGYSDDPVMGDPGAWGLEGFLAKPYTRDQLETFLAKVFPLNRPRR